MKIHVVLFSDFETLDVFGPVEILGKLDNVSIEYYSLQGGLITNNDGIAIETKMLDGIAEGSGNVLLIPGGMGTRREIENRELLDILHVWAEKCEYVLTVCTGSALLAKTGLLKGQKATSNKRAFDWVTTTSDEVIWIKQTRWVVDGKFYTSSGISAGMDMTLGFVSDVYGKETAEQIAFRIEYNWQRDSTKDNFCNQ